MSFCCAASAVVMSAVSEAFARSRGPLGCDPVGGVVSTCLFVFGKSAFARAVDPVVFVLFA